MGLDGVTLRERTEAEDSALGGREEGDEQKPATEHPRGSRDTRTKYGSRRCSGHYVKCLGTNQWVGDTDSTGGLDDEQF